MKIIKFEKQNWKEITRQDNPTWDYINDPVKGRIRREECLIICKVLPYESAVGSDGYSVIHVPLEGDVIRKGLFWIISDAQMFAESFKRDILNESPKEYFNKEYHEGFIPHTIENMKDCSVLYNLIYEYSKR